MSVSLPVSPLEAISKRAACVSLLAIVVLQLLLHPDATWMLRAAGSVALGLGWIGASGGRAYAHAGWLAIAPIAPAILRLLTGREGEPLLDVIWMAGLAGFVLRTISWSRWTFPPHWSVLLGGWAMILAIAWPVLIAREIAFDLSLLRDVSTINSWAGISAPHVVAWTVYVVATQLLGLLWFDWAYGAFGARRVAEARLRTATAGSPKPSAEAPGSGEHAWVPRAVHGLWIGVTAASIVAIVQGTVDLTFLNTDFWAANQRAGGTMLNPNAYGVAAACAGPIGFLAMRAWRPRAAHFGAIILGINWAGLWMSGSRTALVCGAAGALGLAIGLWRSREQATPRRLPLAATAVAAGLVVAALVGGAIGPLQRLVEVPLSREGLASLWNRGEYGPVATEMMREYPLTGVGVAAYHYLAPDYWRVMGDDQLAFDNAQNWWRHQVAELGILGGALVLLWSAVLAWQVIRLRPPPEQVLHTTTVRALVAGIAVASLLGMPTQSPVVLLWFFLLVAWLCAPVKDARPALAPRWIRAGWIAAAALAVAYAGSHLVLASGPLSVAERAKRFRHEYVAGAYAPEEAEEGDRFRWTDDESRFILPARSQWMVLRLWAHHPDIEQRPVHVTISTPCGVFFERELTTTMPISLWVVLPGAMDVFDASITVSRTWSPSDFGSGDARRLGVAVLTNFPETAEGAPSQDYRLEWRGCPADLL